jgi:putative tricarboxylic transport membrane protein
VICLIGAYSLNNSTVELMIMVLCGIVGYLMNKYGYPAAPLVLALVLGPMFEESLRQTLIMSKGSLAIFFTHPISAVLVIILEKIAKKQPMSILGRRRRLLRGCSTFTALRIQSPSFAEIG